MVLHLLSGALCDQIEQPAHLFSDSKTLLLRENNPAMSNPLC